jgi:hypothetical protein
LISSIDNISLTALSYNLLLGCFLSKTKPELVLSSSNQENSLIVSSTIFPISLVFSISEKLLQQKISLLLISPILVFLPLLFPTLKHIAPFPRVFQGIFGFNLTNLGKPIILKPFSFNLFINIQAV